MNIAKATLAIVVALAMTFQPFTPTSIAYAAESAQTAAQAVADARQNASAEGDAGENSSAEDEVAEVDASNGVVAAETVGALDSNQEAATDADAEVADEDAAQVAGLAADNQPEAVASNPNYAISSLSDLETALKTKGTTNVTSDGATIEAITTDSLADVLILLSQSDPALYFAAAIKRSNTGSAVNLTGTTSKGTSSLSFQNGLGNAEHPFSGSITDTNGNALNITVPTTLFEALGIAASEQTSYVITWAGKTDNGSDPSENSEPMLANKLVNTSESTHELSATVTLPSDGDHVQAATTSSLIGDVSGDVDLSVTYTLTKTSGTQQGNNKNAAIKQIGNVGLLVNTVESGKLTLKSFGYSQGSDSLQTVKIESTAGHAGYLVGQVKKDAAFSLDCRVKAPESSSITASSSDNVQDSEGDRTAAGGLIGKASGATISIDIADDGSDIAFAGSGLAVVASNSGGLIGLANDVKFTIANGSHIEPAKTIGNGDSRSAGAIFGEASFAQEVQLASDNIKLPDGLTVTAYDVVGGLVGVLGFPQTNPVTVTIGKDKGSDSSEASLTVNAKLSSLTNRNDQTHTGSVGGLVGAIERENGAKGKLVVCNVSVDATYSSGSKIGGVVGSILNNAFVDSKDVSTTVSLPESMASGFGGLVGLTKADIDCAIVADNLTVSTGTSTINRGGGVVGSANSGTVVKLIGVTDLTNVKYGTDNQQQIGQVIGAQDCALVFASGNGSDSGWTLNRSSEAKTVDDIGSDGTSYGEIIRLTESGLGDNFIALDESGNVSIGNGAKLANADGFRFGSVQDFAKLAITWQSQGVFSAVENVNADNWQTIASKNITLANDINLAGTGLTGLSRDNDKSSPFTGTLSGPKNGGGSYSISLAIGEAYGKRNGNVVDDSDEGNGRIYYHQWLGLFSAFNGYANNVTVAGVINFKAKRQILVGGLGAVTNDGTVQLTDVQLSPEIAVGNDNSSCAVGNAFGAVESGASIITFGSGCEVSATITTPQSVSAKSYIGGAIGYVNGNAGVAVNAQGLSISGSIRATTGNEVLAAGGFVAFIDKGNETKRVMINDLNVGGLSLDLTTSKRSGSATGGFLGYNWANTETTIKGTSSLMAFRANGATLNANSAYGVGGLLYHAGGKLTVDQYAIDYSGAKISNVAGNNDGRLGLLVCRGGQGREIGITGDCYTGSLYLESTADWASAYVFAGADGSSAMQFEGVSVANFDEWVADTIRTDGNDIFESNANGVVSLHTTGKDGGASVDVDALYMGDSLADRNSYVNRSRYGTSKQSNPRSRYYYNLDRIIKSGVNCANGVTTPAGLLLWSVYNYVDASIRGYFTKGNCASNTITGDFDMRGYSYYPIDLYNTSVTIDNATFTFYNSNIETLETGSGSVLLNKLTQADSQHKAMHCGLFRNLTTENGNATLSATNVQFAGAIGKVDNASGVLVCGVVHGSTDTTKAGTYSVVIKNDTDAGSSPMLNGLSIAGFIGRADEYAPLLLNATSDASALNVSGVSMSTTGYTSGNKVASSLIGNVGNADARQVSATFSMIQLASKQSEAIFSKATLLQSFSYSEGGSATYNFTKDNRNAGWVTFGKEIDHTSEYSGEQLWYAEADHDNDNLTTDGEGTSAVVAGQNLGFGSGYLPYVATTYTTGGKYHEIAVNHQAVDIVTGCGTYGHPYEITSAQQMRNIAQIINSDTPPEISVRVTTNQNVLCDKTAKNEAVYKFKGSAWMSEDGDSISTTTMRYYFQSAYYQIVSNITLADFDGLGTSSSYAFRGVIVGSSNATLTLERSASGVLNGLIKYSYGSVVKDLDIEYCNAADVKGANEVEHKEKSDDYMPQAFFGGVIGCILGGDNIIDGVSITVPDGNSFKVKGSGDKYNLVPIGGYVGVIAGGGVIFRKSNNSRSNSLNRWHDGTKVALFYDNDYLGRMLDGYAFSEGCELTNGDEGNYKINKITPPSEGATRDIVTSDVEYIGSTGANATNQYVGLPYYKTTTTINTAQGLLVLSGIINSGAASGMIQADSASQIRGTRAYRGGTEEQEGYSFGNNSYGKVRNANYAYVGESGQDAQGDFANAKSDDMHAPDTRNLATLQITTDPSAYNTEIKSTTTNTPYLVTRYANSMAAYICTADNPSNFRLLSSFTFKAGGDNSFDVSTFGSGYLGLTARYVANAALCGGEFNTSNSKRTYSVNPRIYQIQGNGVTLKAVKQEKEYATDDYHTMGVGALFSTAGFSSGPNMSDQQAESFDLISGLSLTGSVGIGYFDSDGSTPKTLNAVEFSPSRKGNNGQDGRLKSIFGVGGIAGILSPDSNTDFKGGKITDVHSSELEVNSPGAAGSMFGMAAFGIRTSDDSNNLQQGYFTYAGGPETDLKNLTMILTNCTYSGATITGGTSAGGLFGYLFASVKGAYTTSNNQPLVGSNSTITSNGVNLNNVWLANLSGAGGLVGYGKYKFEVGEEEGNSVVLNNVSVENKSTNNASSTGGVIGYFEGATSIDLHKVQVKADDENKGVIHAAYQNAGGLIGRVITDQQLSVVVSIDSCSVEGLTVQTDNAYGGGVVGKFETGINLDINDVSVSNTKMQTSYAGGIVGNSNSTGGYCHISNSKVVSSTFTGQAFGAVIGETVSSQSWSNILVKGNTWNKPDSGNPQGVLAGWVASSCPGIKAAGVDIELKTGKTNKDLPTCYLQTKDTKAEFTSNSFVSYTNYCNVAHAASDADSLYGATAVDPYANTLPVGAKLNSGSGVSVKEGYRSLGVQQAGDQDVKSLFGDGMNPNLANPDKADSVTKTTSNAESSSSTGYPSAQFVYENAPTKGSLISGANNISTVGTENGKTGDYSDFNVLVLTSGESALIDTYLDTVTNGGYSQAKALGNNSVRASVQSLKYDGHGVLSADDSGISTALSVRNNGTSDMDFPVTSGYDNTLNRITLLTVTFTAADGQQQIVYVPIVVRRIVQIDFTATLREGTYFNPNDYASVKDTDHVLTSYGSSMTGYLSYQYNTELGQSVPFDWNSYLLAGGDMRQAEKTLQFNSLTESGGKYPFGTQLVLVDTEDSNKQYHYEVTDPNGIAELSLSEFYIGEGASKTCYKQRWMSDVMDVSATPNQQNGRWVVTYDESDAKASGVLENARALFRPWDEQKDGKDEPRYTLTVGSDSQPIEDFYLVVYFPNNSSMPKNGINGSLDSDVTLNVPRNVNNKLRQSSDRDDKSGTPSTYNILSGFSQAISDQDSSDNVKQTLAYENGRYQLVTKVRDTISFSSSQVYNNDDALYFKLNTALAAYAANNDSATQTGVSGFPTKSAGEVSFYVHSGDQYLVWDASKKPSSENPWSVAASKEAAKLSYEWQTNGDEMQLVLGQMVGNNFVPVNLSVSWLKQWLTADTSGNMSFSIDMEMTVEMDDAAHTMGIQASMNNGEDAYTKLIYRGMLATSVDSLDHSYMTVTTPGYHDFYRTSQGTSTVSLAARFPYQLGINIDDLASADGAINATGTYDLSGVGNIDDLLDQASGVEYAISLQKRKDTDGNYEPVEEDISGCFEIGGDRFSLSDDKKSFIWNDGSFASRTDNDPHQFMVPLTFNVDTTKDAHTYANYRIVFTARLLGKDGNPLNTPSNGSDYITYTLTRVNLNGIS